MDGVKHSYLYAGGKLLRETYGDYTLDFFYDSNGTPYALKYNGTTYYYITNLQGDVMSIVDAQGATVASYQYDPYGNVISSSGDLAAVNPLRYRGYYYDSDSSLYYLQSRYYDPKVGRFINADSYASTGQGFIGYNMFAYCRNNPVNMYDPGGRCSRFLWWKIDCKQVSCPDSKNYVKPKDVDPIGTYDNNQGYVYVVKEDQLEDIMEDKEDNVVIIVDYRTDSDPNMRIIDSYKITKKEQQKEIAQLMLDYNTDYPVEPAWFRTLDSLVKEWEIHNTVYMTGFFRDNTKDCDFNNRDEGKGYLDFFEERVLQ